MKYLILLLFTAFSVTGLSQTVDYATVSGTNPSAQWEDFKWTWQNQDDRNFVISFTNEFNIDNVLFRLSWPERGPYYLEVVNGVVSESPAGTSFTLAQPLSGTNIPPIRIYFAEFLGVYDNGIQRTLAKGRIDVKWSLFSGTNEGNFEPISINYGDTRESLVFPFVPGDLSEDCLIVDHNFGAQYVTVQVYDQDDQLIIPDEIILLNSNQLEVCLGSFTSTTGNVVITSGTTTTGSSLQDNLGSHIATQDLNMNGFDIINVGNDSIVFQSGELVDSDSVIRWNDAYGWGDHSLAGYATGTPIYTETPESDPVWNSEKANYATGTPVYVESDPTFTASAASGILVADITEWDTAYSWGDHASAGYLITESDPVFTASPAGGITGGNIINWDAAFGWGDHAAEGYLTSFTESDPAFTGSPAGGITALDITQWNTAYGWGDHSAAGYLTSFTETDPVFSGSDVADITDTDQLNWDTAYGWGNHALAGYLTSEFDPVFAVHPAAGIDNVDISNWNTAYSWGDHAAEGYLTSESDPVFNSSPAGGITNGDTNDWQTAYEWGDHAAVGYLTSFTETDPVFQASDVADITNIDQANWDTAFGWGDHALAGYLTSFTETDPVFTASDVADITDADQANWDTAFGWGDHALVGYLTSYTETDPVFAASDVADITNTDQANWDAAFGWGDHALAGYLTTFSETDPVFTASDVADITDVDQANWDTAYGWGDHSTNGYLTSVAAETDPVFTASVASAITVTDTSNWTTAYSWGDHALAGYLTSFTETDPVFTASVANNITAADTNNWTTAYNWGDHSLVGYLTNEVNDLTASVIWANVPDANITESSVTQHVAALNISTSQITDLVFPDGADNLGNHIATQTLQMPTNRIAISFSPDCSIIQVTGNAQYNGNYLSAGFVDWGNAPGLCPEDNVQVPYYENPLNSNVIAPWSDTDDFGWGLYPDFATFTNSVGFDADYAAVDTIDACYVDGVDCPGDFPANWFAVLGTGTLPTVSDITPETEWAIDVPNRTLNETWFVDTDATNGQEIVSWQVLTNAIADLTPSLSEVDPVFTASVASDIDATDTNNWTTAFSWGDHATAGYLTSFTETDPVFTASPAGGIVAQDITNWDAAFGWGDHALAGYLTSFTEVDPLWSAVSNSILSNTSNWTTAFGWGDHAAEGYLTTETDPVFTASPAGGIVAQDITNWDTAFGWGDHAVAGYQTGTEQYVGNAGPHVVGTGGLLMNGGNILQANKIEGLAAGDPASLTFISDTIKVEGNISLDGTSPLGDGDLTFGFGSKITDAAFTPILDPAIRTLLGPWEVTNDADAGQEIVNYQSMTNYTYSQLQINTILTGATARVGFKVNSGVAGTTPWAIAQASSYQKLDFLTNEVYDTAGVWDPLTQEFTPSVDGVWLLGGKIRCDSALQNGRELRFSIVDATTTTEVARVGAIIGTSADGPVILADEPLVLSTNNMYYPAVWVNNTGEFLDQDPIVTAFWGELLEEF